jgi:hypothetical protein
MTELPDKRICINVPAQSTALVQAFFLAKHQITLVWRHHYSPGLSPCNFWFFSKLKSPLKVKRLLNAMVTQHTSSFNGVSLPTD